MPNFNKSELFHSSIYYIMSEQPNCCPNCQRRLDIIKTVFIENEEIQVNYCGECDIEVLMIEEDVATWPI
ncbi:MAG: hypothetical protein Q7T88_09065 [Methylotenera sp.]|nr:hypothetical protein [Methylotenera sp.]